jgi:predicted transcriptional regulator
MKKITIPTNNPYLTYLKVISSIINISDKEIELIYLFKKYDDTAISSSDIKKKVAEELNINIKTLHIMLRNLENKKVIIKKSRGVFNYSTFLKYDNSILINING